MHMSLMLYVLPFDLTYYFNPIDWLFVHFFLLCIVILFIVFFENLLLIEQIFRVLYKY